MRYFTTFTGVEGFGLGITQAIPGAECVGVSEIDKYANQVLRYHYPEVKNYGNIKDIKPEELPDFEILCGGFPCQSFSIAGQRLGFDDTRGTLFYEVARIAKIKRPTILFLENVKGLLNHEKGRTFKTIISALDELGYDAEWELLNSKYFGVPQNRERVFIIGHLRGKPWRPIFPICHTDKEDTRIIGKEISNELKEITSGQSQGARVYDPEGTSCTLASQAGGLGAKTGLYKIKQTNNARQGRRTYGSEGISPTLTSHGDTQGGVPLPMIQAVGFNRKEGITGERDIAGAISASDSRGLNRNQTQTAVAVLTPDRAEKRQNGRRMKEEGEEMFTLTAQDKHGVILKSTKLAKDEGIANCLDASYAKGDNRASQKSGRTKVVMHSLQERSADRPSLKKNPKAGGSGHLQKNEEAFCLDTGATQAVQEEQRIRRLTPRECEFLQDFPKDWTAWGIESFLTLADYNKRYGTSKKTNSSETLRILQETIGKEKTKEWGFDELITLLQNEILQPRLYEESIPNEMAQGKCVGTRLELQSKAINICEEMFKMWKNKESGYPSQRQEQIEQQFGELRSALQKLPYKVAQTGRWMEPQSYDASKKEFFGQIHIINEISDSQRYKMMGNAVSVCVIRYIAEQLNEGFK